jgi:hypothetical protein
MDSEQQGTIEASVSFAFRLNISLDSRIRQGFIKGFIIVCIFLCESFPQVFGGNPLVPGLWMPE